MKSYLFTVVLLMFGLTSYARQNQIISLNGDWNYRIDKNDLGISEEWYKKAVSSDGLVQLPGTTDTRGIGPINPENSEFHLNRAYKYRGAIWFETTVTIPPSWNKKAVSLELERVQWESHNYKKYGYIPADLEYESVAQTLEFSYDDWCVAQMAKMLNKKDDYEYFLKRSESYQKVFDKSTNFMRGRMTDGSWHSPFNPFNSIHRSDDYCEGNAWQWTFFVPHNIKGLADLMGSKEQLILKLDSLFAIKTGIEGARASGDISGMIGQYAQGNEPSHHIAFIYDELGQAWKAQKIISEVMNTLYLNSPEGYCGNEDTGQMAAWYLWNALGMYPVTHGDGRYYIGTPLFKKMEFKHANGTLTVISDKQSPNHFYIDQIKVNGKEHKQFWFDHNSIFKGDVTISFKMSDTPNKDWFIQ